MQYNTKFEFWDKVVTKDMPSKVMQVTRVVIDIRPPYIPIITYMCQNLNDSKQYKVLEKNLKLYNAILPKIGDMITVIDHTSNGTLKREFLAMSSDGMYICWNIKKTYAVRFERAE